MKAISIALKDLRLLFQDRPALFQLFLLPLLFIVVVSGALGAVGQAKEDERIPLAVVDLDKGRSAQTFIQALDGAGGVRVEMYEQAKAATALDKGDIARALTIPAGFTTDVAAGRATALRLVNRQDANAETTEAVRLVAEGVARDMSLQIQILEALQQMGQMQAGVPQSAQAFTVERMQAQALSQFQRSRTQRLVSVVQRVPGLPPTLEKPLDFADTAVPGFAVLFVFLTAQQTARSIYEEKKTGTFRRLLAAPVSKAALLAGKMLPNFLTVLLQVAVIFAFGILGLRLMGLPATTLGPEPLTTVLVVLLIALCSSAFGILIAAIARTEGQIGGVSTLLLWGLGVLGGSLVPLFILEKAFGSLPKIVPHYWANHALTNLMIRGLGIADVTTDMIALLGFSALFFGIGLWRFRFD